MLQIKAAILIRQQPPLREIISQDIARIVVDHRENAAGAKGLWCQQVQIQSCLATRTGRWRSCGNVLAGGVLAAMFLEGLKIGFGIYVSEFPTYEIIYGPLAVVPLFML